MVHGLSHDMVLVMVDKSCPWLGLQFPSPLHASAHNLVEAVALKEPRGHGHCYSLIDGHCYNLSDGHGFAFPLSFARPRKLVVGEK